MEPNTRPARCLNGPMAQLVSASCLCFTRLRDVIMKVGGSIPPRSILFSTAEINTVAPWNIPDK